MIRVNPSAPALSTAVYAASTGPAPGTTSQNVGAPANPPTKNAPGRRSRSAYDAVIDQFAVGQNPRYAIRDTSGDGVADTFCNIFAWDVMSAMGVQLPHWTYGDGTPAPPGYGNGGYELDANEVNRWLNSKGAQYGWKKVGAAEAQAYANQGLPVVASQLNPGGIGHVGVVRPGAATNGPALAQAGARNFNQGHVYDTFTPGRVELWVNTTGGVSAPKPPPRPKLPVDSVTAQVPQGDLTDSSSGPEVRKLQRAMVVLGYLKQADREAANGRYTPATVEAVKAFQRALGLSPVRGGYGPLTRAALMKAIAKREPKAVAPPPPLARGARGAQVKQLKTALYRLGYVSRAMLDAHPDEFGSGTEAALKRFQQDHGLTPSGKYGTGSEAKLKAAIAKLPGSSTAAPAPAPAPSAKAAKIDALVKGTGLAGHGADLARLAQQYRIPAELALAMFWHEAQFMTTGLAPQNNNPGNLRFVGQPGAVSGAGGFARWPTVTQGLEAYFKLMSTVYRDFVDRKDWAGLVHKYAPSWDGNDEAQYVRAITQGMASYAPKIS